MRAISGRLSGRRIAILATDGVEQVELEAPRDAYETEGAITQLIAPQYDVIQAFHHQEKGAKIPVDVQLSNADARDFDALLLPGGLRSPDVLRTIPHAVGFVRAFVEQDKPIAAICHGLWMLVEADAVDGCTLTSWPSLRTDLENAGAEWVDKAVVRDRDLVTSRMPDDLPAFIEESVELFSNIATSGVERTLINAIGPNRR